MAGQQPDGEPRPPGAAPPPAAPVTRGHARSQRTPPARPPLHHGPRQPPSADPGTVPQPRARRAPTRLRVADAGARRGVPPSARCWPHRAGGSRRAIRSPARPPSAPASGGARPRPASLRARLRVLRRGRARSDRRLAAWPPRPLPPAAALRPGMALLPRRSGPERPHAALLRCGAARRRVGPCDLALHARGRPEAALRLRPASARMPAWRRGPTAHCPRRAHRAHAGAGGAAPPWRRRHKARRRWLGWGLGLP